MIELMYESTFDGFIRLYQLIKGKKEIIEDFGDREEMLLYIEENFDMVAIYIAHDK